MTTGTDLAVAKNGHIVDFEFDERQLSIIQQKYSELDDRELAECIEYARLRRLNPITGQVHFVKRRLGDRTIVAIQTGIDGFRVIAKRSKKYRGQQGPFWCGADGVWKDAWLLPVPPVAAKVAVLHADFSEPLWAVARFDAYASYYQGKLQRQWATMPDVMIAKCAEALALRKAFPDDLGGMYADEEMEQADQTPISVEEGPTRTATVKNKLKAVVESQIPDAGKQEIVGEAPVFSDAGGDEAAASNVGDPSPPPTHVEPKQPAPKTEVDVSVRKIHNKLYALTKHHALDTNTLVSFCNDVLYPVPFNGIYDTDASQAQRLITAIEKQYGPLPPRTK